MLDGADLGVLAAGPLPACNACLLSLVDALTVCGGLFGGFVAAFFFNVEWVQTLLSVMIQQYRSNC